MTTGGGMTTTGGGTTTTGGGGGGGISATSIETQRDFPSRAGQGQRQREVPMSIANTTTAEEVVAQTQR
jgi:hypothetical protein